MTNEELRAAIEAALRRRDPEASVRAIDGLRDDLAMSDVRVVGVRMRAVAPATSDALRSLAIACGLRVETCGSCGGRGRHAYAREVEDGCGACECAGVVVVDPAEEVARLDDATRGALDDLAKVRAELNAACAARTEAMVDAGFSIGATHEAQQDRDAARRERDEARADAARAREAYSIDLAGLRDTLRRADDLRVMWRERVADVASERDALRAELEDARAEAIESERRLNAECSAMDDRDEVYRALRGADDGSDDIVALAEWRMSDLAATRAALRANLRCDECEELATRAHADTARFGCDAHGVGEGWADTAHAAAVRAALR